MRRGGCAEHRRLVLRTGASRWAPPAEPSMYMSAALVSGMFHVKPRRFAEESLSSGFGRRTSRQICGRSYLRPMTGCSGVPRGRYRSSPSDEYGARVPHTLRREEQKSVMFLIACAESQCWARSHAAGGSTPSLGSGMRCLRIGA